MATQSKHDAMVTEMWRHYLTTGEPPRFDEHFPYLTTRDLRRLTRLLPSDPRCKVCNVPFRGFGGVAVRLVLGREPSKMNPTLCNICEQFAEQHRGGAEIELSMLFADVRGSTALAEGMRPADFSRLIDRFYKVAADVMIRSSALIEKLIGDEVAGLYVPGFAGPQHARAAVEAAEAILQGTGHARPEGPWIPVGAGVHTGIAYVGAVGSEDGVTTITALGDAVNVAARLASEAGPGELLVSEEASRAAGLDAEGLEARRLMLKGRSEPFDVRVIRVGLGQGG